MSKLERIRTRWTPSPIETDMGEDVRYLLGLIERFTTNHRFCFKCENYLEDDSGDCVLCEVKELA